MFRNLASRFGSIAHFDSLNEFGVACSSLRDAGSHERLVRARLDLCAAFGSDASPHALLDAAGVVGAFTALTRVVDLTGHRSLAVTAAARVSSAIVALRKWSRVITLVLLLVLLLAVATGILTSIRR